MSQVFDLFVCSRTMIERWAETLKRHDEELRRHLESEMPRLLTFKSLGHVEFNLLARCAEGGEIDTAKAVGQIDLVDAVSEEEGPWLMAFRPDTIEAIAGLSAGEPLVERWGKAVARFYGTSEDRCRQLLTVDVAKTLKELCSTAVEQRLGVFTCFYG